MFKATLADVSVLRDSISSIAELIDEGVFKISDTGISFVAADRAMVSVVDFRIASSAFEKYELDKDESVGLNISNLFSILKRAGAGDKLNIDLQNNRLVMTLTGSSRRRFQVPIVDIREEEIPPIGQLEFKSRIKMKPEVLQNGIADAEIIGDSVIIEAGADRFGMVAEGDVSKAELELSRGNEALIELAVTGNIKSRYALDYLKKMAKAAKIADTVSIEYGQDYPMKMGFAAGDKVSLNFILAPRVTEND